MIEIRNLSKSFGKLKAIKGLNLSIAPGINGLVGHNGAGKSTLLRLIADVYIKDEGSIVCDGFDNASNEAKSKIFFLSDNPYFQPKSRIKDVYALYDSSFPLSKERFDELISFFRLPNDRRVDGFSKGMLRQLFISIALSSESDIYLLDEAFDGLDPLVVEEIGRRIIAMKDEKKTFIISSHNIASLHALVDTFIILSKGELSANGNEEELSDTFVKYQIMAEEELTFSRLKEDGFSPVSVKKLGSICHAIFLKSDSLKEKLLASYHPSLLEEVPIDAVELIAIEMKHAEKEAE